MFDALNHLYLHADPPAAHARAQAAGVEHFLLAGTDPEGWRKQRAFARTAPDLLVAYGLHPWFVDDDAPNALGSLREQIQNDRPVAVGEIGLDRARKGRDYAHQRAAFDAQLQLAAAEDLPVVLHIVRAHGHAIEHLLQHPPPTGMVHGFTGPAELARRYVSMGLYISFGPWICDPRARKAREAARGVPLDRLLVESDAPDRLPEPSALPDVLAALSALRSAPVPALAAATTANALAVYGVKTEEVGGGGRSAG